MSEAAAPSLNRRRLIELVGASVGGAAAYQVMTRLGFATESPYRGPIKLDGDPKGASVVILGAGLAGMTAAIELERAGYRVSVLEFNLRPGGRNWTLRGGDVFTELGGATQTCAFDPGPLHQSGAVADSLSSSRDLGLLPPVRGRARTFHPAQSQRVPPFLERVRRQAAAYSGRQGRFRRRRLRAPGQGDAQGRARRRGVGGRSARSCSRR